MCTHLYSVGQCCIQHGEDGQVSAQVRHRTSAEVLRKQIKQHFYILAAQLTEIENKHLIHFLQISNLIYLEEAVGVVNSFMLL